MRDPSRYLIPGPPAPGQARIRPVAGSAPPLQQHYRWGRSGPLPRPGPRPVTYATWSQRVCAYLIDMAVLFVPMISAAFIGGVGAVLLVMTAVLFYVWNTFYLQGRSGQTLGKARLGIYLRSEADGEFIGVGLNAARQLAHCADGLVFDLGYLWPIWDKKGQTFADKLCGTVVTCS